jgi:benzoylformate decarboxylase
MIDTSPTNRCAMSPSDHAIPTDSAPTTTVREAVLQLLRAWGITTIFGNPGSTELPLFLDFPSDFRYVLGLQESVVVGMADGFAQASGSAAFVNLHSAAGVGHAMGNIFTAHKNRTPMVITAGQQARSILPFEPFLFSAQATELPKPYVKWSCEPARAEDVPLAIARAYYTAMQEPRGPVLVSIPADDWARQTTPVAARSVSQQQRPDPTLLDQIGAQLDACQRPALVVGAAADRAGAWDAIVALAERHQARVWIAPMSGRAGFPETHALFGGFLPAMREQIVQLLAGHDLVLALGAPAFTYHVEGQGPHLPAGARLAQIVDDPQVAAWAPVGLAVVGNIRLAVQELLGRPTQALPARSAPAPRAAGPTPEPPAAGQRLSTAYVLHRLDRLRPKDAVVVEEAPSARSTMQRHLPMHAPGSFYTMCSGGLGYSLPAAVGVALASPGRRIIALIGDGSAMYAIQALWSAAQLGLPLTVLILKNRSYAALNLFAPAFGFAAGAALPGTALPDLDFVALAHGHGCQGLRADDAASLERLLPQALAAPVPTLLEIDVE